MATRTQSTKTKSRRRTPTDHEKHAFLSTYLEGHDPDEIAASFGYTEEKIFEILAEFGYKVDRFEATKETINGWKKLYLEEFWTFAEIAEAYSSRKGPQICPGTVAYALARRGVRARRAGYSRRLRNERKKKEVKH